MEQKPLTPPVTPQSATPQPPKASPKKDSKSYVVIALFVIVGFIVGKLAFDYLIPVIMKQVGGLQKQSAAGQKSKTGEKKPSAKTTAGKKGKTGTKAEPIDMSNAVTLSPSGEHIVKTPVQRSKTGEPQFLLNGIFFADNSTQGTALVNDRIVQEGDMIEGAKVIKVSMDSVELDYNGKIIKLINR